MKRLFVSILSLVLAAGMVSAQDLATVTEAFNKAGETLNAGDKDAALAQFVEILPQAEALGADGEAIVAQCKSIIPSLYVSVAKAIAKTGDNAGAIKSLEAAVKTGTEYGDAATVEEAGSLIKSLKFSSEITKGTELMKAGDFDGAIAVFEPMLADVSEANAALVKKQLSNAYLRKASAKFKAKDMKGALEAAQKSIENEDNANAQKIAGHAANSLKQYKIAAEAYEAYLAMNPNAKDKVQIIYQCGSAYQALGDGAKACGYFKEIAQDPKFGEGARYQMTVLKCN